MPHGSSKIVVFEIEKVQLIRRRCRTYSGICEKCGRETDLINLNEAARLFGINSAELFRFAKLRNVHFTNDAEIGISLCVNSLLELFSLQNGNSKIKLLG